MTILKFNKKNCVKNIPQNLVNVTSLLKIGISKNVKDGARPIHGLRTNLTKSTSGWYIWAGEWSDDKDFFVPLHGGHLDEWLPQIKMYLALPPGWRILLDDDYEDVWRDPDLEL